MSQSMSQRPRAAIPAVLQLTLELILPFLLLGGKHTLCVVKIGLGFLQAVFQLVQAVQPHADLKHTQLVTVDEESACFFALYAQRLDLHLKLGDDVADAV